MVVYGQVENKKIIFPEMKSLIEDFSHRLCNWSNNYVTHVNGLNRVEAHFTGASGCNNPVCLSSIQSSGGIGHLSISILSRT